MSDSLRDRIAGGRALVAENAREITKVDLVVILAGISDCLTLTSAFRWHRGLDETLTALFEHLPLDARIAVAEIPPLENAGSLSRAARLAAGYRSILLNPRTRKVLRAHPRARAVSLPRELPDRLLGPSAPAQASHPHPCPLEPAPRDRPRRRARGRHAGRRS